MDVVTRLVYETDSSGLNKADTAVGDLIETIGQLSKTIDTSFGQLTEELGSVSDAAKKSKKEVKDNADKLSFWQRQQERATKAARSFGDEIKIGNKSLTEISDGLKSAASKYTDFGKKGASAGKTATKGFSLARAGALALGVGLGLLVGVIGIVAAGFSRSQKLMDLFGERMAQVRAIADVFLDRISFLGEAIVGLFSKDIDAGESLRKAFKGLGDELEREIALSRQLEINARNLRREGLLLDAQRGLTAARLKELNFIAEDVTKSDQARIEASKEALRVEEQLSKTEIENAKQRLANKLGEVSVGEKTLGVIDQLASGSANASELMDQIGISNSTEADLKEVVGLVQEIGASEAASLELRTTANNKLNTIEQQRQARYQKAAEERRKAEQELLSIQDQIQDSLRETANLQGEELIEANRKLSLEQINNLEAETRAKYASAKVQFDAEAEFIELRKRANKAADKEIVDFKIEEQRKAIELRRDLELAQTALLTASADEELSLEEFKATERVRIQKAALQELRAVVEAEGGNVIEVDVQIAELEAEDVATLDANTARIRDEAIKRLEQQQELEQARIEILTKSDNEELTLEEAKELKLLQLTKQGIEARTEILRAAGADQKEIDLLDLQAEKIQQEIDALEDIRIDPIEKLVGKIKDAFNLSDEDFQQITGILGNAISNITAGVEGLREAELSRIDVQIEAAQNRADELRDILSQEESDRENGYANNVETYESALAEQERIEAEAIARRLDIQKRAANQQLAIETAQQAASLTTAATKLIASEASKGLIGLVIGIGALSLLFATVTKARANAAQFAAQAPVLREGGKVENGVLVGPSHEHAGMPIYYNKNGNRYAIEAEGDERIFSRKDSQKYDSLFSAIQGGSIASMPESEILAAVGRKPIPNAALGTPIININSKENDFSELGKQIANSVKPGIEYHPLSENEILIIDRTGIAPRFSKQKIS